MIELNKIYNEDNASGMKNIPDNSINCIITDPPYLYLKNQKLDRPFDENHFFSECKRVLKDDGFIALFGRGQSFYRWNTILAEIGFKFKEEIIWNKIYSTSPVLPLSRKHETISLHTITGCVRKVHISYLEMNYYDHDKVVRDLKRLNSSIKSKLGLANILEYLESGNVFREELRDTQSVTVSANSTRKVKVDNAIARMFVEGVTEQSIISQVYDRYTRIHPTQKPVRLLERLLALVTKEGDTVLDPFSGSASTAIAAYNTGRNFIGFEIDKEYYDLSIQRIDKIMSENKQMKLFNINYGLCE